MSSTIKHCKNCTTTVNCHLERKCLRQAHGLSMSAGSESDDTKRLEAALVRIAKAHGIESPLVLIAMAENDEENYAEILARYIENEMQNIEDTHGAKRS